MSLYKGKYIDDQVNPTEDPLDADNTHWLSVDDGQTSYDGIAVLDYANKEAWKEMRDHPDWIKAGPRLNPLCKPVQLLTHSSLLSLTAASRLQSSMRRLSAESFARYIFMSIQFQRNSTLPIPFLMKKTLSFVKQKLRAGGATRFTPLEGYRSGLKCVSRSWKRSIPFV